MWGKWLHFPIKYVGWLHFCVALSQWKHSSQASYLNSQLWDLLLLLSAGTEAGWTLEMLSQSIRPIELQQFPNCRSCNFFDKGKWVKIRSSSALNEENDHCKWNCNLHHNRLKDRLLQEINRETRATSELCCMLTKRRKEHATHVLATQH